MSKDKGAPLLHRRVTLSITPTALSELQTALDEFWLQTCHISEKLAGLPAAEVQYTILAATMEIAENIVHHAYPIPNPENWLRMEISLFTHCVEVILSDGGRAFDPPLNLGDLSCLWRQPERSGWGLLLAQQAVDAFSYRREGEINCWRLVKLNRPLATKLAEIDDSRYGEELGRMGNAG